MRRRDRDSAWCRVALAGTAAAVALVLTGCAGGSPATPSPGPPTPSTEPSKDAPPGSNPTATPTSTPKPRPKPKPKPTVKPKPTSTPKPKPKPKPSPTVTPSTSASFSGVVRRTNGQPVAGVWVEFKSVLPCTVWDGVCKQAHTTSDHAGRYRIRLAPGSYNALCGWDLQTPITNAYECGPQGGDGGPFIVEVPPHGQRLDFVVCATAAQWPSCLEV